MDRTMCMPQTCWTTVVPTAGSKASLFADKAKGRKGSKPFKPFKRVRDEWNFSFLRADHDIRVSGTVFNERRQDEELCALLGWVKGARCQRLKGSVLFLQLDRFSLRRCLDFQRQAARFRSRRTF